MLAQMYVRVLTMKIALSVVIPAHDEESSIEETVESIAHALIRERVPFEIVVVNDHSTDTTATKLVELALRIPQVRTVNNEQLPGYGRTVVGGINAAQGMYVAIMMADLSDDPEDLVRFYRTAQKLVLTAFSAAVSYKGWNIRLPKI